MAGNQHNLTITTFAGVV